MSRKSRIAVLILSAALIALSLCAVPGAMAKSSSSSHQLRFKVVKRTSHYDVVKGHSHRFAVKRGAHKVTVHGVGRYKLVRRTSRFVFLRAAGSHATSKLTITTPNSGDFVQGSPTVVTWRMSSAVSTGYFRVSMKNTLDSTSTGLTAADIPVSRRTTTYSVPWDVAQATGTHRIWVYYYASGGRSLASDASNGTVSITAAPVPTPTLTPTPTPTPTPTLPPSGGTLNLNPSDGYTFNGGGTYTTSGALNLGNNCTIVGVNFTNGSRQVVINGNRNTVRGCTFGPNNWAALMIEVGAYNVIDGNAFNTVRARGANIQVCGGGHNQITNNTTKGGVTGIIFLYRRSLNGGGLASLSTDNVVSGNTCSGFSEEGITFDVMGNSAPDIPCLEYDTVKAVSGSTITLSALPFPSYVGYDMVFLSGALNGRTRSIVGQSGSGFTLDSAPSGVAVGDKVVIGATFKRNLVTGNTVTASSSGWPAINLYGLCYQNLIENNHVLTGAIKVESTDNLDVASGSVTRTYGRAPCGYNTVRNNIVAGAVQLQYYVWPTSPSGHANTYPAFQTVGNNAIGNTCSRVEANEQWCHITGNSGGNQFSDVTLSPAEMQ